MPEATLSKEADLGVNYNGCDLIMALPSLNADMECKPGGAFEVWPSPSYEFRSLRQLILFFLPTRQLKRVEENNSCITHVQNCARDPDGGAGLRSQREPSVLTRTKRTRTRR